MNSDPDKPDMPVVLTIAGSDCSGGAGVQADLKTINGFGCFGMSVITAITAQNSSEMSQVHVLPGDVVKAQLDALLDDYSFSAIKIGMIGSRSIARVVAERLGNLQDVPIILDTPLRATVGGVLGGEALDEGALARALVEFLFPLATLITPNIEEAGQFLARDEASDQDEMIEQARALLALGGDAIFLKGGHLKRRELDDNDAAIDIFDDGATMRILQAEWVGVRHTHGTGCALASAIAASMAKGASRLEAVLTSKDWLTHCLQNSQNMGFGCGSGPLNITFSSEIDG